jgi:hypothetical protein
MIHRNHYARPQLEVLEGRWAPGSLRPTLAPPADLLAEAALVGEAHPAPCNPADAKLVAFQGTWTGRTVSAVPVSPDLVFVVASGSGEASDLGRFTMVSPHYTVLSTLAVYGQQLFTAANGDTLTADFTGQFHPNTTGDLEATLSATITGGTGRFSGATGSYSFHIIAHAVAPGIFASTATFSGMISSPGANR